MDCPIPKTMNLQKHWRNHEKVTDQMVAWFKNHVGCKSHEGIMDVSNKKFNYLYKQDIPDGYVCWQKVNMRYNAMHPLHPENIAKMLVITSLNGRDVFQWKKVNQVYKLVKNL